MISEEDLLELRVIHGLNSYGQCDVCISGGSMDSERQSWPCESAGYLWTGLEIQRLLSEHESRVRAAYIAHVELTRATTDRMMAEEPEAFWADVENTARQWVGYKAMRKMWDKAFAFSSMPVLRFERFAGLDGVTARFQVANEAGVLEDQDPTGVAEAVFGQELLDIAEGRDPHQD